MSHFLKHYYGLSNFKKDQLDSNREAVFDALKSLESAQVEQIYDYLKKENEKKAQTLYESGKITKAERKEFIKETTLSKRTIHRHLNFLLEEGLVGHFDYKYYIVDRVKRDIKYWSHEFGVSILDELMRSYFPHVLKFEENIEQLINIFGIYAIYCLAKATQPRTKGSDDRRNNLDRDSLIISWVNEVFNTRRMLEYFVAIMDNLPSDDKVESIRNNTFVKGHPKYPSWLDKIKKVDSPPSVKHIKWRDRDRHDFSPEDAYIIRGKKFGKLLLSKAMSDNIIEKSNFVLEVDITHIIRVLEKKYHTYYEGVIQNNQIGDIVETTNKKQTDWEKEFSLSTDEMIDNVRLIDFFD
jgi:Fe2+ or Zn2+ uptake regulation protein